jgi:hypothetical protein
MASKPLIQLSGYFSLLCGHLNKVRGYGNFKIIQLFKTCLEDILVDLDIVNVDGSVEGDGDHLGNLGDLQPTRHLRTVKRTEAVGQHAVLQPANQG